jgi:hypothetical protein
LLKGFRLDIVDDFKSSKIDIIFDDVKIVVYDNHLIDALKFIADFLNYELKGNAQTIHLKNTQTLKKKIKKEQCHLLFKNVVLYYYVDFVDIFTIKISDYSFNIDDNMLIPKLKIYHQTTNKLFLMRRTKALSLHKFHIKFEPELNEIYIEFGDIHFNFYCFELAHPIVKMFIYHHFFPNWIIYHMHYKHKIDHENRQIYIDDFAKKDKCFIKFEAVYLTVNQHDICSASAFQTNPAIMEKKVDRDNSKRVIEYLKGIKSNQIALKVTNFTIITQGFSEKETTKEEKRQSNQVYQFENTFGEYVPIVKEKEYFRKSTRSNLINNRG